MNEKYIDELLEKINNLKAQGEQEIEELRVKLLGKKGEVTHLFEEFRTVPPEQKKLFGQKLNVLKNNALAKIEALKESLADSQQGNAASGQLDLTMPGDKMELGARHPISITREEIISIFKKFGYTVAEGPEIEDDWHVFGALNFPPEHPARDMQDTFFIDNHDENKILLRTHTSSVQVRSMERMELPIRVICPGRVFRNEAISARAHCIFHQVEGLYIDRNVSFADLKQAILLFAQEMFGPDTKIRMRPSYFPFTEPSAEVDVSCNICKGKGCNICKGTGWLEILGCGMVDPAVLEASGIDSKEYSGFAFGMGIERIAMLKWQVNDLRHYFENDVRFLREFETVI
ncbi:MAG: phenylalanine--tRNA ligase subunit alpha [Bacteroidales bacterium]|nr:phenylalanine--tRNA ligase subunit alpha [Bacteroidales bacterium]